MPEHMRADVGQVIAAIEDAFRGVTLENGISLREAIVLDNYGTDEERQKARAQDELHDWRSIPDDLIALHSDSLAFLDAKGMLFSVDGTQAIFLTHESNYYHFRLDQPTRTWKTRIGR